MKRAANLVGKKLTKPQFLTQIKNPQFSMIKNRTYNVSLYQIGGETTHKILILSPNTTILEITINSSHFKYGLCDGKIFLVQQTH